MRNPSVGIDRLNRVWIAWQDSTGVYATHVDLAALGITDVPTAVSQPAADNATLPTDVTLTSWPNPANGHVTLQVMGPAQGPLPLR